MSTEATTYYTISVTRHDPDGGTQVVEFEGYAVLQELFDDIAADRDVRRWLEPEGPEPGCRHPEKCNAAGRCMREIVCNE